MADDECFPPGLQRLTEQLASATIPGINELPDLTNTEEYGPCFNAAAIRSQGEQISGGSWAAVRLKVLSLVATCPTLTHVNLSNCCIDDESEMRILGLGLEKSEALEFLDLSGNMAVGSKSGCGYINRILKGCKRLRQLNAARVGMGWEGMAKISGAMGHNIALRHLDISGNPKLGDNGMALLSAVLKGQLSSKKDSAEGEERFKGLTSLTLGSMTLGGARHLAEALASQSAHGSLEVLKIVRAREEDPDEVEQEEGEGFNPLLVLLGSLIHPGPPTEYDDLAAPAMYNESLKVLSLKFIQADGLAGTLAEILRSNNTLLELHLEGSEFSSAEWREILHSLHENTSLNSLFLGSCRGLGDMFQDFMDLVRVNSTIEFIELPKTELEESGKSVLILEALSNGSSVNNSYSPEDEVRQSFQKLNVQGVPAQPETRGEDFTAGDLGTEGGSETCSTAASLDLKSLPRGLYALVLELTAEIPTITVLPRLSTLNTEEFGDYFAFPHFTQENKDEKWWQTRRAILHLICSCSTLTHIDLEGCGIHKEEEVEDLCLGLAISHRLEVLNLGGNGGFGTEVGCLHLCRLLVKLHTLKELHLHAIDMKPDFLVYLTAAMRKLPDCSLQTLDINFNSGLGDEGAENLATLLADPEDSLGLRHLRMFGTGMGIKGAFLMAIALRLNTSLKSLFVGFETEDENSEGPLSVLLSAFIPEPLQLETEAESGPTRQLGSNTTVENLGVCGGRETGLASVLSKILEASKIRALTLNCTYLTPAQWREVFSSLRQNTSLEALDMTQCEGLDASVHEEMMAMLQSNQRLSDITLTQTELERTGSHLSIHQQLIQRTGSSDHSSESPFLTPSSSGDWSGHSRGSTTPGASPYEVPGGGSSPYHAPPPPYHSGTGASHPALGKLPSWIPNSSATPGPPSYFSSSVPPSQPTQVSGPPPYFPPSPSQGPPKHQSSVSVNYPHPTPPIPPHPGFSNPVPGAYQSHGGGYMMSPEPVSGHHRFHHQQSQQSQQSQQQSQHHYSDSNDSQSQQSSHYNRPQPPPAPSPPYPTSNEWSPSGEPAWWAKPEGAQQPGGAPSEADDESVFDESEGRKSGKFRNWAREKKEKMKGTKVVVTEVARHGKDLVKDLARERKDKVLGKLATKLSSRG
ncbi:hypothetical protein R1sor_025475 [Riccia sorocarpa]|uniref:Uncharacterized protein n=1 Tax=Riccia sorocarpa TaxID=122646 RepID=A0ABD3G8R2_9MARC